MNINHICHYTYYTLSLPGQLTSGLLAACLLKCWQGNLYFLGNLTSTNCIWSQNALVCIFVVVIWGRSSTYSKTHINWMLHSCWSQWYKSHPHISFLAQDTTYHSTCEAFGLIPIQCLMRHTASMHLNAIWSCGLCHCDQHEKNLHVMLLK